MSTDAVSARLKHSVMMNVIHELAKRASRMASKGPGVTVSGHNVFATWLEYRTEGKGMERTDVLKELNDTLGRKYDNSRLWQWVTGTRPAPDPVLDIIDGEMEAMVRWLFKSRDWSTKGIAIKQLADALRPSIKRDE